MTQVEIPSDMAHGCQCHLKLWYLCPGFPISALPCLCPFRASSSATPNMTLFVQWSSTPTAHICIRILQKAHPFSLFRTCSCSAFEYWTHCCSKGTQNKGNEGLGSQATHLSADGRNVPRNTSLSLPQKIKSELSLSLNIKLRSNASAN